MGKRRTVWIRLAWIGGLGAAALWLWTADAESRAHYTPGYPREELEELLSKDSLTEEEYNLLFLQTGMSRAGVDQLFQEGRQQELLYLQERFFLPVEYECRQVNPFCRGERLLAPGREEAEAFDFLPAVRTGDILVTFSGHFFGWRSGHAGIVIDGEKGLTLEAVSPGSVSRVCTVDSWAEYPCFVLLRLKNGTEEEAAEIASYAAEYLTDVPYELFCLTERTESSRPHGEKEAGTAEQSRTEGQEKEAVREPDLTERARSSLPRGEKEEAAREQELAERQGWQEESVSDSDPLSGTQCAHLVWSAFYRFGYDIDSDGGRIVTPADLYESELLEVIQLYGLSPLRKP